MNAALAVGANYFDFASFDNKEAEQKTFHARFKKRNVAAWINCGIGPGLTNDLAVKLMKGLEECRIMIRVAEHTKLKKDENGNEPLIFLWKPDLVVDEMTSPVYVTSKDPHRANIVREPFSGSEDCKFPYHIGTIKCRFMNENEDITLKYLPNFYEIDVKTGGDDVERLFNYLPKIKKKIAKGQIKKYLKELKTSSPDEIKRMLDDGTILNGHVAIIIEVKGKDAMTKKIIVQRATWMGLGIREVPRGTTHISYNTALIASFAIQKMIKSSRLKPGIWAPEEIPETDREAILKQVDEKTNPVLYETL
jgi:saccharopine dehydrogenase-like NADP-dependent oxidoreductase